MTVRFDAAKAARILELIAEKGVSLTKACDLVGVARRNARDWAQTEQGFANGLQLARVEALEILADEILSIGDEVEKCVQPAMVNAARVRIDARKWLLSKLNPERYGEKIELSGTGGRDLLTSPEAQIPKLMAILAIVMPDADNSKLHELATQMAGKLREIEHHPSPGGKNNGHDED